MGSKMLSFKFLYIVLCLGISLQAQVTFEEKNNDSCVLPNDTPSTCVVIDECEPIKNFVQSVKNLTKDVVKTLQSHQCGFDVNSVKLCCPKEPIITTLERNNEESTTNHPVNLQSRIVWDGDTNNDCRLPDHKLGKCVTIRKCAPVVNVLIGNGGNPNEGLFTALRKYQCSSNSNEAKVCCPNEPIVIEEDQDDEATRPPPPNVERHGNFGVLPTDCGLVSDKVRITGGNETGLFEFPWMALISYRTKKGPDFQCAGTIINSIKYILTAAHCVHNRILLGVRVGDYNIPSLQDCEVDSAGVNICAPPVQDVLIEDTIIHSNYSDGNLYANDIALLRLRTAITISDNTKPICLPTSESLREFNWFNFIAMSLIVTGWGVTEKRVGSDVLLKTAIPIITLKECRTAYQALQIKLDYKQLCGFDSDGRDACKGDSGGPLQKTTLMVGKVRYVQFAIVSFGPKICGTGSYPGVYTRLAYFMDWILDHLNT